MRQDDGIGVVASATFAVRRPGRLSYAALAAVGLGIAIVLIVVWDAAWWQTVAFALAPDLAVLYGIAPGLARGQLHPRAVPIYNALHQFWGPLALGGRAPGWHAGLVVARRERLVADSAGEPVATVAEVSPA